MLTWHEEKCFETPFKTALQICIKLQKTKQKASTKAQLLLESPRTLPRERAINLPSWFKKHKCKTDKDFKEAQLPRLIPPDSCILRKHFLLKEKTSDTVELIYSYFSKLFEGLCSSFHSLSVISKARDTYAAIYFLLKPTNLCAKRDRRGTKILKCISNNVTQQISTATLPSSLRHMKCSRDTQFSIGKGEQDGSWQERRAISLAF